MVHPEKICIKCNSANISFNEDYGFYRCSDCGELWAYSQDDLDYEEETDPSAVEELFGNIPYAQLLTEAEVKYINPIPSIYQLPLGIPLNWRMEESGQIKDAVLAFYNHVTNKGNSPPNEHQIFLLKCYIEHYINAPCWLDIDCMLTQLKKEVRQLDSVERISLWLEKAMNIGLDPF